MPACAVERPVIHQALMLLVGGVWAALGPRALAGDITITPSENLQAAINTASSGDTIHFMPGTYNQTAVINAKSLTLDGTAGATMTILSAANLNNTVLRITGAPSPGVTIRGLTIREGRTPQTSQTPDGYPYDGAGISASGSALTIANCRFIANLAGSEGGAIFTLNGGATITDTLFDSNFAQAGGGAFAINGAIAVERCTFLNNQAVGAGGAITVLSPHGGTIANCRFDGNDSTGGADGGGAVFSSTTSAVSASDCQFTGNSATLRGGAIATANLAGAGSVTLTRCAFTENRVTDVGSAGGGMYAGANASLTVRESTFTRNTAIDYGGGLYKSGAGSLIVERSSFLGNTAFRGGGLYSDAISTLSNSVFVGNTARSSIGLGGGLYAGNAAGEAFTAINCTLVANQGPEPVISGSGATTLKSCIVFGNASLTIDARRSFTYSDVEQASGVRAGVGNINFAPMFTAAPGPGGDTSWGSGDDNYGDLRLLAGSPCIDAGDSPAALPYPLDLGGEDRNRDDPATPNTGIPAWALNVDMGAHEFQPGPPQPACPADFNNSGAVSVQDIFDFLAAYFAGCP